RTGYQELIPRAEARRNRKRKQEPMAPRRNKIAADVKVQLNAGAATPAPPVSTALGPHGVNIMDFCKQYNAATESQRVNVIPVEITIYEDRSDRKSTRLNSSHQIISYA